MSERIIVQYVGFQVTPLVREYTFAVREAAADPLEYTLTIANEAFASHRARYQDAPEICSLRLHRELDTYGNHPPNMNFCVTDAELADYQFSRRPKANGVFQKRRDD